MNNLFYIITLQTFLFRYYKPDKKSNPIFLIDYEVYPTGVLNRSDLFLK